MEKEDVCELCGKKALDLSNPILSFYGNNLKEITAESFGSHRFHVNCILAKFKKYVEDLVEANDSLLHKLNTYLEANDELERILNEIMLKGSVSLTENLIIYSKHDKIFLKVTDYEKGYWAQVPLNKVQLLSTLSFFKALAGGKRKEGKA
jgi:hypothetical protein